MRILVIIIIAIVLIICIGSVIVYEDYEEKWPTLK